jgi:inorganic pyrophosphatase
MSLFNEPSLNPLGGFNFIVEIPAGTNTKYELHKESNEFLPDLRDGRPRIIDFLGYPGNYGFIPSTIMDKSEGGDGDALDGLIICESVPTGTVLHCIAIAVLELKDEGELDTKIIGIPYDPSLRTIQCVNYQQFRSQYRFAKLIIERWFLNYDPVDPATLIGWGNEKKAMKMIDKWKI